MHPTAQQRYLNGGDTLVRRRQRRIIYCAGQSNMVGQGAWSLVTNATGMGSAYSNVTSRQITSQGPTPTDPPTWSTGSPGSPVIGALQPYTSSVANIAGATTDCIGLQLSMGHYLDETVSEFDVSTFALSGTSMDTQWKPTANYPSSGPNLYNLMITDMKQAENDLGGTISAFVWYQGETDAQTSGAASNYQTNFTDFLNGVRANFPNVPIVVIQINSGDAASFVSTVRTAQATVAGNFTKCTLLESSDMPLQTDSVHVSSNGYIALGYRVAMAVLKALGITDTHTWTKDATSLIGMPQNAKEWETFLSSINLIGYHPHLQWDLTQPSAGTVTDQLGDSPGTFTGTGATFQSTVTGWSTKGITVTDAATAKWATTTGTLPNASTDACMALMYAKLNGTPAAIRTPLLVGTTPFNVRIDTTPHFRTDSGANSATGTANPTGGPRPYLCGQDPASSLAFGATDQEYLTPTRGSPTGKQYGFAFTASPNMTYLGLMTLWGPRVRWTQATLRTLLQGLGWTIPW